MAIARMCFFLKSIDGWTQPYNKNIELFTKKKTHDLPMIKPSMLYVMLFHRLNL
jgi:hypothetical protein